MSAKTLPIVIPEAELARIDAELSDVGHSLVEIDGHCFALLAGPPSGDALSSILASWDSYRASRPPISTPKGPAGPRGSKRRPTSLLDLYQAGIPSPWHRD